MNHTENLSELKAKTQDCVSRSFEIFGCFAVISAALTGEVDVHSKSLHNLSINHVVSLLDVFATKSEELCTLIDEVDHGYRLIIEELEERITICVSGRMGVSQ